MFVSALLIWLYRKIRFAPGNSIYGSTKPYLQKTTLLIILNTKPQTSCSYTFNPTTQPVLYHITLTEDFSAKRITVLTHIFHFLIIYLYICIL